MTKSNTDRVKEFIKTHKPSIYEDQYFMVDPKYIYDIVDAANITKEDRVLEVGAGLGFLTMELAKRSREVLSIEIDREFKPVLDKMPGNVEVVYGDAYRLLNDKDFLAKNKSPNKSVSNIPYSRAQNMLHNYTNWPWYQGDLYWIAPASLVNKVNKEPILSAYFEAILIKEIPKSAFYPEPNTVSAIVHFKRIIDPVKSGDFGIFIRRWLYDHEDQKVKNALREGLISVAKKLKAKTVTKKQALEVISKLKLPSEQLEVLTNNIDTDYYFELPKRLFPWFNSL